jgi:hypothetical protein
MGDAFIYDDIEIRGLIYETREALAGLLAFINVQADQVRNVVFTTQDEHVHYLLDDPRNGSLGCKYQGSGASLALTPTPLQSGAIR